MSQLVPIAVLALVLAGCSDSDTSSSSSGTPTVYTQDDSSITVKDGDEFVIELTANPSTGYSWSAAPNDKVTLLDTAQVQGGSQPGAAGTQRMTFRADAPGTTTLEFAYSRPFEGGVPPAETASFDLTITR